MMALDRQMPFLIDFACYRSRGHAVQDFAWLEAAIKIELMGREVDGAPDRRDFDIDEFDKRCDAEDWLSQWPLDDADLRAKFGEDSPVARAYQLCRHLRQRAVEILNDALPGRLPLPAIRLSYSASLIYHTRHTARCDSLPHLKRVFAIYSVGTIMSDLPMS
jgi:hypothetical protein